MVLAFRFLLRKGLFVVHCFISRLPARELLGISQIPIRVHTSDVVAFFVWLLRILTQALTLEGPASAPPVEPSPRLPASCLRLRSPG